ncbi:hypothetical protein ACFPYI_03015 [Halomarina salina]|uniref:Uncharacterized protein n=1 Tax=Halomarina salina TaxID=1872699 RepID=A0ABD5RIW5_9EURY|nr:hypothetical protein [Halomarina salina]
MTRRESLLVGGGAGAVAATWFAVARAGDDAGGIASGGDASGRGDGAGLVGDRLSNATDQTGPTLAAGGLR